MKLLRKLFDYIALAIGIVSSLITIGISMFGVETPWIIGLCGAFLLSSIVFFGWKYLMARNQLFALRLLSKRGRANTVNFLLLLDYLENDYDINHDNETKTTGLKIKSSEYTFHYYNQSFNKNIDIDYKHRFEVIGGTGHFDAVIMHSNGNLVRDSGIGDNRGVYLEYQGSKIDLHPKPVSGDIHNTPNQHFDKVHWSFATKENEAGWLEFHYRNQGGANLEEDDVFVIYPKNYGKCFSGKADFCILYEKPYKAQITLHKLSYNTIREPKMVLIAGFTHNDIYNAYYCSIPSIDIHGIYFILMERAQDDTDIHSTTS